MKKLVLALVVFGLAASSFAADEMDNKAADRVKAAATVLEEIQTAPDTGIPDEVMGSAECVAVVPSMLKPDLCLAPAMAVAWRVAAPRKAGATRRSSPFKVAALGCRSAGRQLIWSC